MIKPLKTSYLIADGRHARWVERDHETGDFRTLRELHHRDHGAHAYSGSVFESAGGQRHGVREPHEPARRAAEAFAAEIGAAAGDLADRVVLVAPARMLNEIEDALPPAIRARVAETIAKDLTKVADHDLRRWLS
ncbi:MAG TPA: host attachment protein [Caulobacteraceae bacterium]